MTQRDPALAELATTFREACWWVAQPGNDFSWCSWEDVSEALAEMEAILTPLEAGQLPDDIRHLLRVLFAPTGPLQELSLSSGWAAQFLVLADRVDQLLGDG